MVDYDQKYIVLLIIADVSDEENIVNKGNQWIGDVKCSKSVLHWKMILKFSDMSISPRTIQDTSAGLKRLMNQYLLLETYFGINKFVIMMIFSRLCAAFHSSLLIKFAAPLNDET